MTTQAAIDDLVDALVQEAVDNDLVDVKVFAAPASETFVADLRWFMEPGSPVDELDF